MELKKSFEFRRKPTKDLDGNEQPDDEDQLPVMVLALLQRKTGTPMSPSDRKKKLEPLSNTKAKTQNITPKLTFR